MRGIYVRAALCGLLFVALDARPANAQGHAYIVAGMGFVDLGWGGDVVISGGPVGLGGEIAAGRYLASTVAGSLHVLDRRRFERLDVFVRAGYTVLSDLNRDAAGMTVGGGLVYWPRKHVGLRLDGTRFLTFRDGFRPEDRVYWGLRGGVAFGWR